MLDYLNMEEALSSEDRLVRDTARAFVDDVLTPDVDEYWLDDTFPRDLMEEMGELGFFAPNLSGYGLPDVSETAYGRLMQELEACDSGVRSAASVQGALDMYPIHAFGSEAQKNHRLPKLGAGEAVGCFGLVPGQDLTDIPAFT